MYRSMPYKVFSYCNYACLFILSALCVLPLIHVLAISLSSSAAATGNIVTFWPVHFTFEAYTETLGNSNFLHALWIGIKRVLLGNAAGCAGGLSAVQGRNAVSRADVLCLAVRIYDAVPCGLDSDLSGSQGNRPDEYNLGAGAARSREHLESDPDAELLPCDSQGAGGGGIDGRRQPFADSVHDIFADLDAGSGDALFICDGDPLECLV